MAGHSKYKNIMYRKGAQDKKRSALFSKLSREITVAAKMGLPDPGRERAAARRGHRRRAQSMPKDNIQRSIDKASARRRRELRGNPLRGLRPRRRRDHRRGADRQPQPHRDQRPHRFLQERRQPRRQRQRQPRLRAARPDRISGAARAMPTRCSKPRSRPAPTTSKATRTATASGPASTASTKSRERSSRCSAKPKAPSSRGSPSTEVEVRGDDAANLMKLIDALEEDDDVQTVWGNYDVPEEELEKLA